MLEPSNSHRSGKLRKRVQHTKHVSGEMSSQTHLAAQLVQHGGICSPSADRVSRWIALREAVFTARIRLDGHHRPHPLGIPAQGRLEIAGSKPVHGSLEDLKEERHLLKVAAQSSQVGVR